VDLNLGCGMDFKASRVLRTRGVRIILFTGYDNAMLPDDLRREVLVQKPMQVENVIDVVASVCGR